MLYKIFFLSFFQGVIRASVTQDQNATPLKPTTPSLGIQLPVPTVGGKEQNYTQPATVVHSDDDGMVEDDEGEDEDDWDNFQSFPATANAAGSDPNEESVVVEPDQVENSSVTKTDVGSDSFQERSVSQPSDNVNEISDTDQYAGGDRSWVERNASDIIERDEPRKLQSDENAAKPRDNQQYEREEVPRNEKEETDHVEEAEGSAEVNLDEGELRKVEISDTKVEPLMSVSEPFALDQEAGNSEDQRQLKQTNTESDLKSMVEKESDDQKPESSSGSKSPTREDDDAKL